VVKTAETTRWPWRGFMELLIQAGVPPGVVNMVWPRQITGDALVREPRVRMACSPAAYRHHRRGGQPGLKRVDSNWAATANIITESVILEDALDGALASITNNGQRVRWFASCCIAASPTAGRFVNAPGRSRR
jgi:acyl-CoA reductase-like NAD-dependent aldehyde dehydrogenase